VSKQTLRLQAQAAGKSVDDLILDTVRASATMDEAARTLGVSRFTITTRLEGMGLRAETVLVLKRLPGSAVPS
jgi:hypothetical protein